ncbi:hypothetical protein VTJ83DRAFT_6602 [Remersonia thermophila]|uniref:tRNA-splicing endonuclease subunit Sen54 N-terminal domain-containing protein n=1 Tax=Remersonia thermophila TaxID=72144 RepID=A0ABR4D7F4_9PEZI
MPLDDDDNPSLAPSEINLMTAAPSHGGSAAAASAADEQMTAEELLEDEGGSAAQDFRAFATALQHRKNQFRKEPGVSAQTIRRGEKDFESHGTRAQADALEQSRAAMRDVLSYVRVHTVPSGPGASSGKVGGNPVRGWYFPGWWEGFEEVEEEEEAVVVKGEDGEKKEKKPYGWIRERVVVLEGSSTASQALGRAVTGQAKDRPARGKDWLLPEEALYLVERGSLDLWWPFKPLEEIFPPDGTVDAQDPGEEEETEVDEYEFGIPLSLQAAYALLIGDDGERGKISLQKFQVYSNLKRCGYNVLRAPPLPKPPAQSPSSPASRQTLWQWLTSRLASPPQHPPYGPLVRPGLYRSYVPIYRQMALISRHSPSSSTSTPSFQIHFHVWKSAQKWTKLRHPPPDFRLAVLDAQQTFVPSLREIGALLDSSPADRGNPQWAGHPGRMYARLKHGSRNVLLAVVDHGVINYMRFAEGSGFVEEPLYGRFDAAVAKGGVAPKKGGGRNNGRGGVVRGGKGKGRGRGRGR